MTGAALVAALDALADLRIAVFGAFPYLYDGNRAYERDYLTAYAQSPGALVVGAYAGDRLVGAATAAPMADHAAEFAAPFREKGMDIGRIYYFGESVLLPDWRGRGIGHAFFDRREARARELGFAMASFCAVVRSPDHPARPSGYSPLDPFWHARGFAAVEGLVGTFRWKDLGNAEESDHSMQFWVKRLAP
ncbi:MULTISPECIES: GNAT family N-acetyltransferase [Sphingobium]|uniref:GNAT family acetyltransferase n=1 Tax=Sphingobium chungbukense TaxID=56193 RepID=A0A0M3AW35_9SPHN|nr:MULTISPECIES: GNAT family N-acetyltransferase [Sphingobium]KKW94123.1 GNAT family acetyltransferase [Sphingobium chungbukense]PJG49711.1 GNAT family N-acetyltransferase [Sphingobium sp. LB126]